MTWLYIVAGLIVIYVVILLAFVFGKHDKEE